MTKEGERYLELRREKMRNKETKEQLEKHRVEEKRKTGETDKIQYWREMFSKMAEKNKEKTSGKIIPGVTEHIERMIKGRTSKEKERKEGSEKVCQREGEGEICKVQVFSKRTPAMNIPTESPNSRNPTEKDIPIIKKVEQSLEKEKERETVTKVENEREKMRRETVEEEEREKSLEISEIKKKICRIERVRKGEMLQKEMIAIEKEKERKIVRTVIECVINKVGEEIEKNEKTEKKLEMKKINKRKRNENGTDECDIRVRKKPKLKIKSEGWKASDEGEENIKEKEIEKEDKSETDKEIDKVGQKNDSENKKNKNKRNVSPGIDKIRRIFEREKGGEKESEEKMLKNIERNRNEKLVKSVDTVLKQVQKYEIEVEKINEQKSTEKIVEKGEEKGKRRKRIPEKTKKRESVRKKDNVEKESNQIVQTITMQKYFPLKGQEKRESYTPLEKKDLKGGPSGENKQIESRKKIKGGRKLKSSKYSDIRDFFVKTTSEKQKQNLPTGGKLLENVFSGNKF